MATTTAPAEIPSLVSLLGELDHATLEFPDADGHAQRPPPVVFDQTCDGEIRSEWFSERWDRSANNDSNPPRLGGAKLAPDPADQRPVIGIPPASQGLRLHLRTNPASALLITARMRALTASSTNPAGLWLIPLSAPPEEPTSPGLQWTIHRTAWENPQAQSQLKRPLAFDEGEKWQTLTIRLDPRERSPRNPTTCSARCSWSIAGAPDRSPAHGARYHGPSSHRQLRATPRRSNRLPVGALSRPHDGNHRHLAHRGTGHQPAFRHRDRGAQRRNGPARFTFVCSSTTKSWPQKTSTATKERWEPRSPLGPFLWPSMRGNQFGFRIEATGDDNIVGLCASPQVLGSAGGAAPSQSCPVLDGYFAG